MNYIKLFIVICIISTLLFIVVDNLYIKYITVIAFALNPLILYVFYQERKEAEFSKKFIEKNLELLQEYDISEKVE
jgi:hypothetical protein